MPDSNEVKESVKLEQQPRGTGKVGVTVQTELTAEEIFALKEIARDRLATSRVVGKLKNYLLAAAGMLIAYITIVENGLRWLKNQLGMG